MNDSRRDDQRAQLARTRLIGCAMALAMVASPFLALLYGLTVGIGVMALALAATSYLTLDATHRMAPPQRGRVLTVAAVNGVLALACAGVVIARLV